MRNKAVAGFFMAAGVVKVCSLTKESTSLRKSL